MTQDVQPLTWQKRTNLEEHQQFFSKINEIIDNLAPTVDEAEAAIAQATAAIADANAAIATANAASAAASAAASQAQTAASTVAGYDSRLTAAEGDIDDLQAADQQMGFNIISLANRVTATETKNSQQDTAIAAVQTKNNQQDAAISALQTADAQNVKINSVNDYAVGLTGNQPVITGTKIFTSYLSLVQKSTNIDTTTKPGANVFKPFLTLRDKNDQEIATMNYFNPAASSDGVDFDVLSNGKRVRLHIVVDSEDGGGLLQFITSKGTVTLADTRGA